MLPQAEWAAAQREVADSLAEERVAHDEARMTNMTAGARMTRARQTAQDRLARPGSGWTRRFTR